MKLAMVPVLIGSCK